MFEDPTFWVAMAFGLFVILTFRPIGRIIGKTLDGRIHHIEAELAEAVRLREEAQALLAEYQRKQTEVEAEAASILKAAREEAQALQIQAQEQLQQAINNRVALADQKIAQEEEKAIQDVKKQVVDIAMKAARDVIADKMSEESDEALIQLALKDIQRIVH